MITFTDGPAEGATLSLRRTPIFLRVVVDAKGVVDALDQLDDEIRPGETAFVYRIDEDGRRGFVCSRGKGGGCRRMATYRLHTEQADQATLSDNELWGEWTESTGKALED